VGAICGGEMMRCTYPGSAAATERVAAPGWSWFHALEFLPDGFYCPAHSAAIERSISDGRFEDPENGLTGR
jgi:hypothetical protein